jgi:hypothetical protein
MDNYALRCFEMSAMMKLLVVVNTVGVLETLAKL